MADAQVPPGSPPAPFFAGSDDDEDFAMSEDASHAGPSSASLPQTPRTGASSARSSPPPPLFLHDSDVEKEDSMPVDLPSSSKHPPLMEDNDSDIEIVEQPREQKSSNDTQSSASACAHPNAHSPPATNISKKRRLSADPLPPSKASFPRTYLGELLVPNAWSNVSGKGYVKPNDTVLVKRDKEEHISKPSTAKPKPGNGKKKSDGKKQITLATMLKPQPAKPSKKKKADSIVRLVNSKGFEFGRLPTEVSWWIAKLLELDMVEIRGIMTDCPEKLTTGVSLIVTLHIYLLAGAFKPLKTSGKDEDSVSFGFNEGLETEDEVHLRERKNATVKLFDVLGLKPQAGARSRGKRPQGKIQEEPLKRRSGKKVKEIVGDGEEIEVDDGEDLSNNDIDAIYTKAQHNDRSMGEMEPSESFNLTLRGYQKQALFWMHSLETGAIDAREATSMHPLWSQYTFPQEPVIDGDMIDLTADDKLFYFNSYSGELSLDFPKAERNCKGGILAQISVSMIEMGMGKTIMLSALIQTSMPYQNEESGDTNVHSRVKQLKLNNAFRSGNNRNLQPAKSPSATLIVAPTSLLNQWAEELQRSSKPGTLDVFVWHGQNRLDLEALVDNDSDNRTLKIVITSYGVLASEHAKIKNSQSVKPPVFEINWWRVVLDEAHSCKSRTSKTAKAVYALSAKRRWTVTGTPIVNRLEDLYSLLKFLDFKPWSEFSFFRSFITLPFLAGDVKAIEVVQVILESILLRREKNMLDTDGKRIVELPPKEVVTEELEFTPLERKIYDSIYHLAKRNFEQLDAKGLVGKNYTHILAMLMRLRRAVLHPTLVLIKDDERALSPEKDGRADVNDLIKRFAEDGQTTPDGSNEFAENFMANLKGEDNADCPIYFNEMEVPMVVPRCMHQFCKDCIISHIGICEQRDQKPNCPTCNSGPIQSSELVEIASEPDVVLRQNDFQSSTKLDALIQNLRKLRAQDPCFRAVVFSQFTSFLDLIQVALDRERFNHYRFDGTMDVKKKSAAISDFKSPSRKPKVLVVSLKAGGVGLNLTTANHVFMMDCWWNAAVENQAIDRVHRIGQDKTVYVKHFIISKTIEKRILQIQKRKTAIVNEAFRGSGKADPESIQNLKIMFGDD
ncbi:unnamed protein product [Cyclocybe aegerita]|uniref:DNA repair protein RAD5 n=1 Tax=Cyclocybe aegerita TaxID=1973307 RepID=A0A8S0X5T9_CYCAE|nr:unnamed protein product [Cyclocybe aegerita]